MKCLTEDVLACASESERQMEIFYQIPPWIVSAGGPVEDFLLRMLEREQSVLEQIMMSKERNRASEEIRCDNIYYLKDLLRQVRERGAMCDGAK